MRTVLAGNFSNIGADTASFAVRNVGAGGTVGYDFFGGYTYTGGVNAIEVFADEPGRLPSLYIGGSFSGVGLINVAGGVPTGGLARFGCAPCVAFTTQPVGRSVRAGSSVTLDAATLIDGFGATYQWRRDGVPLADGGGISGSATPMLMVSGAGEDDAGSYDLLVTASCGSMLSAAANIAVTCDADVNADGQITTSDVFDYVHAFLMRQIAGDFNRDFQVTVQDLFDFLDAYFRGC